MFTDNELINKAIAFAKIQFQNDFSGHDFYHTMRVFRLASTLAVTEHADLSIVQLAALLHDVDDSKLFGGIVGQSSNARSFLQEYNYSKEKTERICQIISEISFKGTDTVIPSSIEGKIVQDADRLDAIGAIGIARAFAFGGSRGRSLYDPEQPSKENMSGQEYADNQGTTVNHFYEKLLHLKNLMNTATAKHMAERRHDFMEKFLDEFYKEWNGDM